MPQPAERHRTGRPLAIRDAQELKRKVDDYFATQTGWKVVGTKKVAGPDGSEREVAVERLRPATLSGLAVHLGIDRRTLLAYKDRADFLPILAHARARCEAYLEEGALSGELNGQFAKHVTQNNFGWQDKSEVKQTVTARVDMSKMTDEELRKMAYED